MGTEFYTRSQLELPMDDMMNFLHGVLPKKCRPTYIRNFDNSLSELENALQEAHEFVVRDINRYFSPEEILKRNNKKAQLAKANEYLIGELVFDDVYLKICQIEEELMTCQNPQPTIDKSKTLTPPIKFTYVKLPAPLQNLNNLEVLQFNNKNNNNFNNYNDQISNQNAQQHGVVVNQNTVNINCDNNMNTIGNTLYKSNINNHNNYNLNDKNVAQPINNFNQNQNNLVRPNFFNQNNFATQQQRPVLNQQPIKNNNVNNLNLDDYQIQQYIMVQQSRQMNLNTNNLYAPNEMLQIGHSTGYQPMIQIKANQPRRKERFEFSQLQLAVLEQAFCDKRYINSWVRANIARGLGLEEDQVKNWFQNKRSKLNLTKKREKPSSGCNQAYVISAIKTITSSPY